MARWCVGLKTSGLYKEGVVDGSDLESLLEAHQRETASTFGTRRSCRKSLQSSSSAVPESDRVAKEDVSAIVTCRKSLHSSSLCVSESDYDAKKFEYQISPDSISIYLYTLQSKLTFACALVSFQTALSIVLLTWYI